MLTRRHFLRLAGMGAAGMVAGAAGLLGCRPGGPEPGGDAGPELTEPEVLASSGGLLEVRLRAAPGPVRLADRTARTASYNGAVPGPTLRLRPGDRLRLQLANDLDEPTNLHFHGLHVPPGGRADNVFLSIEPGQRFDYDLTLPSDHPGGTFFYHPHRHGLVADQIFAGLYGVILIEGGADQIPEVAAVHQRLLVLSDVTLDAQGRVPRPSLMQRAVGREGELALVNGQSQPRLATTAGSLERWRIVNASVSRFYRLRLDGHALHMIGTGTAALEAPERVEEVALVPGQRAEVLVAVGARAPTGW